MHVQSFELANISVSVAWGSYHHGQRRDHRILLVREPQYPQGRTVAHILLSVCEDFYFDEQYKLRAGKLELRWARVDHWEKAGKRLWCTWSASFDTWVAGPRASVSSSKPWQGGGAFIDYPELKGHRLATYLLDFIVEWLQLHAAPDSEVHPVTLAARDSDVHNRTRRDKLWTHVGFYWPQIAAGGLSAPLKVRNLTRRDTWKANIEVSDLATEYSSRYVQAETEEQRAATLARNWKAIYEQWCTALLWLKWSIGATAALLTTLILCMRGP